MFHLILNHLGCLWKFSFFSQRSVRYMEKKKYSVRVINDAGVQKGNITPKRKNFLRSFFLYAKQVSSLPQNPMEGRLKIFLQGTDMHAGQLRFD